MTEQPPSRIVERLRLHNQLHLLDWWDRLGPRERDALLEDIGQTDFNLIEEILSATRSPENQHADSGPAERARPPRQLIRLPQTPEENAALQSAARCGEQLLAAGKVAAVLVAGGQGTRLEFPRPKGMFPIGPVSDRTLFQIFAEHLLARSRRAGTDIVYYIMTSDATHAETVAFFSDNQYFGLDPDAVGFFRQGNMPAVDLRTGRVLLSEKGRLSRSPDGHGGLVSALALSGMLDDMRTRGVEHLFYHQVDNPTVSLCDPVFLGLHVAHGSEMSTKVVAKKSAAERMGVVVDVDGTTQIIEYSDLPDAVAQRTDSSGELLLWAGSTAVHVIDRPFLERMAARDHGLPFHVARKKVPFIDETGTLVMPNAVNAFKFERFLFDALPFARNPLVVEADRAREFNPVKNKDGDDSPDTARRAMSSQFAAWLKSAGAVVPTGDPVEINPLFALDLEELKRKVLPGTRFTGPVYLA